MILDPQVHTDPATGRPCVYMAEKPGVPASAEEAANERRAQVLLGQYAVCPNSPVKAVPPRPSPGAVAAELFREAVHLPNPTVSIPPGWSVPGLRAYMILGGPQTIDWGPKDVFGYSVRLHVSSTYDIDWGEDGPPGRYSHGVASQGGRGYPDGDVYHVYDLKGTWQVHVSQRWTATYDITGEPSGTIADVLYTTADTDLPVHELQAVVSG
jgi:hypothetical protein